MDDVKVDIRKIRVELDRIGLFVAEQVGYGRAASLPVVGAHQSVIMSRNWLGKALGYLGEETDKKVDSSGDIPKEMDTADGKLTISYPEPKGRALTAQEKDDRQLQFVNMVRARLDNVEKDIGRISRVVSSSHDYRTSLGQAWVHCQEASMQLGHELGRIREDSQARQKAKKVTPIKSLNRVVN